MQVVRAIITTACALLLLTGVAVNFANVIGRYVFDSPLAWAEDFMVYTNIWLIFLGAALASIGDRHLSMELLRSAIPIMLERYIAISISFIVFMACGFTTWISIQFVLRMIETGQRSVSLDVPMYVPHSAVTVGFALMTLALAIEIVKLMRNLRQPTMTVETESKSV